MNDERQIELECVSSIFPEIQLDHLDPFCMKIDLPVCPDTPINANFFQTQNTLSSTISTSAKQQKNFPALFDVKSHSFFHLPSLHVCIKLPDGYPEKLPPEIHLSTNPKWLSDTELDKIGAKAGSLWEHAGGTVALYDIIDFLQQNCEHAFGYGEPHKILELPEELRISLLDFDLHETQAKFDRKTFNCTICLEPKKGAVCHEMIGCKHVFCVQCLQGFYTNAIKAGEIVSVRCLGQDCIKNRKEIQAVLGKSRKIKTLDPNELLQIQIPQEIVTRYVKLKHKSEQESNKNTIYCPRKWCQGAARAKELHKSLGQEDDLSGDEDSDLDSIKSDDLSTVKDLLSVCEDCSFAFCSRCLQSWHGDFKICVPKQPGELTVEDKASLEYLKQHTTPCPTCAAPSQKTHGCNHMICFICNTHFCYLCSSWLSSTNPYKHFNDKTTGCYMRLWELEWGGAAAEGDVFAEGRGDIEQNHDILLDEIGIQALAIPAVEVEPVNQETNDTHPPPAQEEIEWEGPLVLRINHVPQAVKVHVNPEPIVQRPNRRNHRQINNPEHQQRRPARRRNRDNVRLEGPNPHEFIGEEAHQRWVQMFVELALNDQEDQMNWNSDDEQDPAVWEIPVR